MLIRPTVLLFSAALLAWAGSAIGMEAGKRAWQSISPGGSTICSDGSDYRFLARPGNPDRLLFYLQGGGGCWNRHNCDPSGDPTHFVNVQNLRMPDAGIFDASNTDNPFRDHSVVFVPYCTGDVHLGARTMVYEGQNGEGPLTVHHQGRANVQAALEWAQTNMAAPREVFVTGSSAGAIPSPYYASILADAYAEARIAQLGDAAGGYRNPVFNTRPKNQWGTFEFIQATRGFENLNPDAFNYERLYVAAARANPQITFARYDAAEDTAQKRFLAMSGQTDVVLRDSLIANHEDIRSAVPNIRSMIIGGDSHTVLGRPEFYIWGAEGIRVRDWVAALVRFEPMASVFCQECVQPET